MKERKGKKGKPENCLEPKPRIEKKGEKERDSEEKESLSHLWTCLQSNKLCVRVIDTILPEVYFVQIRFPCILSHMSLPMRVARRM